MNDGSLRKYNVAIAKLFDLILKMNEGQQMELLKKAEKLFFVERRGSKRIACRVPVRYAIDDRIFSNYISNISRNGIFIESDNSKIVTKEILLDFKLDGLSNPMKIIGEIVFVTSTGFGVAFKHVDAKLADMIESAVDKMET